MIKPVLLLCLLVIPGAAVSIVCIHYALLDWRQLQIAYRHFHELAGGNAGMRELFVAESAQNIHRINLFADGVWAILGAILAAIGIHGLCLLPSNSPAGNATAVTARKKGD